MMDRPLWGWRGSPSALLAGAPSVRVARSLRSLTPADPLPHARASPPSPRALNLMEVKSLRDNTSIRIRPLPPCTRRTASRVLFRLACTPIDLLWDNYLRARPPVPWRSAPRPRTFRTAPIEALAELRKKESKAEFVK